MEQIEQYGPPPNPVKLTDSRCAGYMAEYNTDESWELDALEPSVLAELIREVVTTERDQAAWDQAVAQEVEQRASVARLAEQLSQGQANG
jgi:hypothetical protein